MKHIFLLLFIAAAFHLQAQNTEVYVNTNNIGINIANPTKYFHLEVPASSFYNGFYTRINYIGNQDRRAVEGFSNPNPGYGIGGHFTGGFRGVYARGDGGTSNNASFPTYGVYAEATGSAGTRIGLFARATGGNENLAAKFGSGDVEIENRLGINTLDKTGRVNIYNAENVGSLATALKIIATNSGTAAVYGNHVSATHTGTGHVYGHYASVTASGSGSKAYAHYGVAASPEDFAFFGIGNSFISGDLRIGQDVDPYSGTYKVVIDGKILAEEVRVQNSLDWPDYVFSEEYQLKSLEEVESFIKENSHLPNIPSAEEIEKQGIVLGEMQTKMMEKIEELTLYLIAQQKEIDALKKQLNSKSDEK